MHFLNLLTSTISILSLAFCVSAVKITGNHFAFGGVNDQSLQYLEPSERDAVIERLVQANARVIRLLIRGTEGHPDPETEVGVWDNAILDQFDDTLAAIHRISKGTVKVIIAPHDAHALRGSNGVVCDAYCRKIDGAFLDFYSDMELRQDYKNRLTTMFKDYKSKNFDGASWGTLNKVIMGVDLQNEPWQGIWPIVAGEAWLCDIATHLKEEIGLGAHGIAILTGGLSGANTIGGSQNLPDSAFSCKAIDVIAIHGYYSADGENTAGTPWLNMFLPGNTLTGRANGTDKLLLVEELSYVKSKFGLHYKEADIWDQGAALNYRGIPWLYSRITTGDEGSSGDVNVFRGQYFAMDALRNTLTRAFTSRSNFDWSRFLRAPKSLDTSAEITLNPFTPSQAPCTFGCLGHLCDAMDGCQPGYICKNNVCSVCTIGCPEYECDNHKNLCQESMRCVDGTCEACSSRQSLPKLRTGVARVVEIVPNEDDADATCEKDHPFIQLPICEYCDKSKGKCRGAPCEKIADCDSDEFCDWGICKKCDKGCMGEQCRSNRACKSGHCNSFGRCDVPPKAKGPMQRDKYEGRRGPGWNVPREKGPSKPRDNAVRINIPKEGVKETGGPVPTA